MIKAEDLSFTYSGSNIPALNHLDLEFKSGEFVVVTGRNGSGKSTLIKALLGIIPDNVTGNFSGRISLYEKPIANTLSISSKVGVLLQNPDSQITNLTVWEEVVFGLENLCLPVGQIIDRAESVLDKMGLGSISTQATHQLSGGQKQRLSLAALMAMNPKVLIMDEPLANLDDNGVESVVKTLMQVRSQVDLIIVSSHIIEPFLNLMTRVVVMNEGQISLDFPANKITDYHQELVRNAVELPHQSTTKTSVDQHTDRSLITTSHLKYIYSNGICPLTNVNLTVHQGEKLTLIGQNGAGKSTLARLLTGLRKPTSGSIENHAHRLNMIPQEVSLSFMESSVTDELLALGIEKKLASQILDECDLAYAQSRSSFQLSGGQQRLLAIALAVATHPDFLVIDEPTAGLDADHVRLILQMTSGPESVLHITHDHRVIDNSHRIIRLQNGIITEEGGGL